MVNFKIPVECPSGTTPVNVWCSPPLTSPNLHVLYNCRFPRDCDNRQPDTIDPTWPDNLDAGYYEHIWGTVSQGATTSMPWISWGEETAYCYYSGIVTPYTTEKLTAKAVCLATE